MWQRLVASKYGEDHFGWKSCVSEGARGCSLWKGICKGDDYFFRYVRIRLTMVNELVSGMMCGVVGSLLPVVFSIDILLWNAKGDRFEII